MGLMWMMRRFSIRLRMVGAIGVVLLLLGAVGASGLWGMTQIKALSEQFTTHSFAESMAMADLRVSLSQLQRYEKDMIIQYENPTEISALEGRWYATASRLAEHVGVMTAGEADADNAVALSLHEQVKAYIKETESVIVQLKQGGFDTATVANLRLRKAHEHMGQAETLAQQLTHMVVSEARQVQDQQASASRQSLWLFLAALGFAMVVVVPTTLANMQSICKPISQAQQFAEDIAAGRLDHDVKVEGQDEVARLLRALNAMKTSIAGIVGEVRQATQSIRLASEEIASGNHDLSARTEQAAGSLEETASSLGELTGNVRQSAEAARRASETAQTNAAVASQGGAAVGQVVSTMDEIARSSHTIRDIIGVIDGIAFQTNILALNAAVEAARAGEAGRGFAVVAGEVRNLAQRSAEAASQIKALIGNSVERVATGTAQVQHAGQTINAVVTHAQQVSELIGDITRAMAEQSQGISEINAAVARLDQMTQQNAALVEESAASSDSLREQAERLSQVVAVFRLAA